MDNYKPYSVSYHLHGSGMSCVMDEWNDNIVLARDTHDPYYSSNQDTFEKIHLAKFPTYQEDPKQIKNRRLAQEYAQLIQDTRITNAEEFELLKNINNFQYISKNWHKTNQQAFLTRIIINAVKDNRGNKKGNLYREWVPVIKDMVRKLTNRRYLLMLMELVSPESTKKDRRQGKTAFFAMAYGISGHSHRSQTALDLESNGYSVNVDDVVSETILHGLFSERYKLMEANPSIPFIMED